jgi:hypothetical protein
MGPRGRHPNYLASIREIRAIRGSLIEPAVQLVLESAPTGNRFATYNETLEIEASGPKKRAVLTRFRDTARANSRGTHVKQRNCRFERKELPWRPSYISDGFAAE